MEVTGDSRALDCLLAWLEHGWLAGGLAVLDGSGCRGMSHWMGVDKSEEALLDARD
jgi:hypothetical protein